MASPFMAGQRLAGQRLVGQLSSLFELVRSTGGAIRSPGRPEESVLGDRSSEGVGFPRWSVCCECSSTFSPVEKNFSARSQ